MFVTQRGEGPLPIMTATQQLLTTFYEAFQRKDYATMQACYADTAVFNDPAFPNLNAAQVRAMWEMLIRQGKDMQLTYRVLDADDTTGHAEWTATYTFSKTGRPVVNHVRSSFTFAEGKIVTHTDRFDFHTWARQALGLTGLLLGWTSFLQRKVQQTALGSLATFMSKGPRTS
ncbi:nuclear transport factor 2 family protein [Fibrella sp. WM1]|uniref:nuclear transport factor 2 family protein n=1 Tax=Fibrella musci TaxID=3242485 RepID=UPI0035200EC7